MTDNDRPDPFRVQRIAEQIQRGLAEQDRAAQRAQDEARAAELAAETAEQHARDRAEYRRLRATSPFAAAAFGARHPHVHDKPEPPKAA